MDVQHKQCAAMSMSWAIPSPVLSATTDASSCESQRRSARHAKRIGQDKLTAMARQLLLRHVVSTGTSVDATSPTRLLNPLLGKRRTDACQSRMSKGRSNGCSILTNAKVRQVAFYVRCKAGTESGTSLSLRRTLPARHLLFATRCVVLEHHIE